MRFFLTLALATPLVFAGAAGAQAFQRNVTVETGRGEINRSVERYCFDGTCYLESQLTGVNGETLQRSGACTQSAPETWTCKVTGSTSTGRIWTRQGIVVVN